MTKYRPFYDEAQPKRRYFITAAVISSILLLFFLLAFVSTRAFLVNERNRDETAVYNITLDDEFNIAPNDNKLLFEIIGTDLDTSRGLARFKTKLYRVTEEKVTGKVLLGSLSPTNLTSTSYFVDTDSVISTTGDLYNYPFDTYYGEGTYTATDIDPFEANATFIPFGAFVYSTLNGWQFQFDLSKDDTHDIVYMTFTAKRGATTKIFSVFIMMLMWCLSLSAFFISLHVLFRGRDVAPPLIGTVVALLFAMPSVRNVQPSIPPIGVMADVASLFFNMVLIAISAIILMIVWIRQSPQPKKEPSYQA